MYIVILSKKEESLEEERLLQGFFWEKNIIMQEFLHHQIFYIRAKYIVRGQKIW